VTSHDVVNAVRKRLGIRRVGHTGTLDPFATGLLIVLVNRATRLLDYLAVFRKSYQGVIRLGTQTTTDDPTGDVIATGAWRDLTLEDVRVTMQRFIGEQEQRPPLYSAKKIKGKPAHRRLRRGEAVSLPTATVTVFSFDVLEFRDSDITFTGTVSTGTYMRSLARDLGEALGCGAHLSELRRTAIEDYPVRDAVRVESVEWRDVRQPGLLVSHLPRVNLSTADRDAVFAGRPICSSLLAGEVDRAALFADDRLVAIAEVRELGVLQPRVVLA